MQTLLTMFDDGVLIITLNRPEKFNAWNYQMHRQLNDAVEAANNDKGVDAIVVTGAGKGFCAGVDMSAVFGLTEEQKRQGRADSKANGWIRLVRQSKPMIAAVNGAAIGLGVTLILAMDQIIAATEAKFALPFVKIGIVPELAASSLVERRVGFGTASRLLLTGDTLTAQEALDISLIDRVVPADVLLAEATALARRMGRNPHAALLETKQLLTENANEVDLELVQQRERDALTRSYATAEHKEAVAAFIAKRPPDFKSLR